MRYPRPTQGPLHGIGKSIWAGQANTMAWAYHQNWNQQ